uniref:PDR_CDR domain-containing protein n=1 Tax=Caenorhabditis tropicalis TaxID=1561998 RepID=A0A1I7TB60_9PELO
MITYFAGSAQSVNNFLFRVYEYFFGETLTDADRVELKHELRYYGVGVFRPGHLVFIYNVITLWLTIKFKQSLNEFEPVPTEPTAPQLAHNPAYAEPPLKSYPNMA